MRHDTRQRKHAVAGLREISGKKRMLGTLVRVISSGKQALEAGFVDGVGYFDDAIDKAEELAKIKKAKVIRYTEPFSIRNLFRLWGKNDKIFPPAGAEPYKRDLKTVDFHLIDAGHFALETNGAEIAGYS